MQAFAVAHRARQPFVHVLGTMRKSPDERAQFLRVLVPVLAAAAATALVYHRRRPKTDLRDMHMRGRCMDVDSYRCGSELDIANMSTRYLSGNCMLFESWCLVRSWHRRASKVLPADV